MTDVVKAEHLATLQGDLIDTSGGNPTVALLVVAAIAIAALGATVALAWHGTVDGQAAVGIILTVIAGTIGAGAHAAGTVAGAKAARR